MMSIYNIHEHSFTQSILKILQDNFGEYSKDIFSHSPLLIYLNNKTRSANRGSKARGAFANHYALFVLVEDYIKNGYSDIDNIKQYSKYEGAKFTDLLKRQRELPFGAKLQNHALNSRLNDEFKKFFPTLGIVPIIRDVETQRYWIQESLLNVSIKTGNDIEKKFNIAKSIIEIITSYINTKLEAFESFIKTCKQISKLSASQPEEAIKFVESQLAPNVDARVFEIVSYAVLKTKFANETIWIGKSKDNVYEEILILYKTGRTNANDGGIDFVMRPIGRFFQVTETIDVNKYFLDIDKVNSFPITFVVKSNDSEATIKNKIREQALQKYGIEIIVDKYISCIEEIINVKDLLETFAEIVKNGQLQKVMEEIIAQSMVEFNYDDE